LEYEAKVVTATELFITVSHCSMKSAKRTSPVIGIRERQIALQELSAKHIQDFYLKELERVSASSVIHYHANIHKALKYAVSKNPGCVLPTAPAMQSAVL